jgi:esterase/lipase superfamily enzyme
MRQQRQHSYTLAPGECRELGGFDFLWEQLREGEGGTPMPGAAMQIPQEQQKSFHAVLSQRLSATTHKDVYVFIHGFNNSFADAVYRAGEVWHFMGRVGVPVAYTWPAGRGGPLGYLYDRESGEFTVFHLKQFLRCLAACPQVERVHLVAHSRGTDVAISALRELHAMYQAQGRDTRNELKLENLVLAAPDLDEDVFVQRFIAENLLSAARRTTIYTSPSDRAIELADVAFASRHRLGQLGPSDFSPTVRQALARLPMLQFVECRVTHFSTSHDYVFAHPAALSDLILVLRERRDPGAEHGRPLRQSVEGVWELDDDYLLGRPAARK